MEELQDIPDFVKRSNGVSRGEVLRFQSGRIEPDLVDVRVVRPDDIGIPAVANHQRFDAAGVGGGEGMMKDATVRLVAGGVFGEDDTVEVGRETGGSQFAGLHFAETVGEDESPVVAVQVFHQFVSAGERPFLIGRSPEKVAVYGEDIPFVFDTQRAEDIAEPLDDKRVPVDLAVAVLCPEVKVVRHIDRIESLEGGVVSIPMVVGIHLFEAFPVVLGGIQQGIVQINE